MSLIASIVSRYGGSLSADKQSGAIPAPGHSARDRSVSLRLSHDGKLLIHCFSDTDWRDIRAMLLRDGVARYDNFFSNRSISRSGVNHAQAHRPRARSLTFEHAKRLWARREKTANTLAGRYLELRRLSKLVNAPSLGFVHLAAMSPQPRARIAPCLLAKISNANGRFVGIQGTFLFSTPSGLFKKRLIFGHQKGHAIQLATPDTTLLVGEGLESTASAANWFGHPAWALLNTANLATFRAPRGVQELIIAADHDAPGIAAAEACRSLNEAGGVRCMIKIPVKPNTDWNDASESDLSV